VRISTGVFVADKWEGGAMRSLPAASDRNEFDALVIRTDHTDEPAWQVVTAALTQPWADGEGESSVEIVDDPAWARASVDEVLAAIAAEGEDYVCVVFLADRTTMQADHHGLLAVTTITREELDDDEAYEAMVEFGREFRTVPVGVSEIHANLHLANMDFEEFSAVAAKDPEGVYRSF